MSNYAELYEQVMGYMQQSLTLSDPFPGTAGDADTKRALIDKLCLRAANNVRKRAELLNDWVYNQVSAEVTVPAGESILLENLTDLDSGDVFTGFKNVKEVTYEGVPINLNSTLHGLRRKFMKPCFNRCRGEFHGKHFKIKPALTEDVALTVYGTKWMDKYTSVATVTTPWGIAVSGTLTDGTDPVVVPTLFPVAGFTGIEGETAFSSNGTNVPNASGYWYGLLVGPSGEGVLARANNAVIDIGWEMASPADTSDPFSWELTAVSPATGTPTFSIATDSIADWLLVDGFEYMQWATICELNHLLEVYLPRQEGKLPPPDRQREESLEALMRWDTEMRDAQLNMKSR
jgi:hypothetical protein